MGISYVCKATQSLGKSIWKHTFLAGKFESSLCLELWPGSLVSGRGSFNHHLPKFRSGAKKPFSGAQIITVLLRLFPSMFFFSSEFHFFTPGYIRTLARLMMRYGRDEKNARWFLFFWAERKFFPSSSYLGSRMIFALIKELKLGKWFFCLR